MEDSYQVHIGRLTGITIVNEIVDRTTLSDLTSTQLIGLVWSTLSCVHHFYIRLNLKNGLLSWMRKRQAKKAMDTYERLLYFCLLPHSYDIVVHSIITFYTESNMWITEHLATQLLKQLLMISKEGASTIHSILDVAEKTSVRNIVDARQIIRVLYQVLENYPWHDMDDFLMVRLLTMYHRSIVPSNNVFDYVPLRKGIEVTLRHILINISSEELLKIKFMVEWVLDEDITEEALLDFGNLIEYAAVLHETYLYRDSLYPSLFPMVLELVGSDNQLYSLLGNRILQNLLDRHHNVPEFDTPKIFFANLTFNIMIGHYNSEDKSFIRTYRELIHTTLLNAIKLHGNHRINLETEVPCGYTAAAVVCLAMDIQETAISNEHLELECSHRLHATVMSIISLVCWVHNAQVFYDYVQQIVEKRAKFAPHLNPPLRATYQYAQHHVLWNKPELFFEDWEARPKSNGLNEQNDHMTDNLQCDIEDVENNKDDFSGGFKGFSSADPVPVVKRGPGTPRKVVIGLRRRYPKKYDEVNHSNNEDVYTAFHIEVSLTEAL
ncbi:hypothetical protein RN001_013623 [Aquatica leii]|uniref:Uncharacterized protein n=1 Tax=Aquatica leii TaxID=1421715 RepID=A0AAN7QDC4_9COLE|nr:hypothetical protein RN001_013623 [Aquatica leii]